MRPRIVWTIFRKEIRESLRDKRTIRAMIILPVLLYPMLILGISWLQNSEEEKTNAHPSNVAVWGEAPPALRSALAASHIDVKQDAPMPVKVAADLQGGHVPPMTPPKDDEDSDTNKKEKPPADTPLTLAARQALLSRKVDAVLVVWPRLADALAQGGLGHVAVLFDSTRPASDKARDRLNQAMNKFREQEIALREQQRGLKPGFSEAVEIGAANVAPPSRQAGFGLGMILPFLLITMCLTPLFYAAIDATAGEKERNTMQTLLCAPLRPLEIISGKFLAVALIGIVSAGVNIISLSLTVARIAHDASTSGSVALSQYVLAFLLLVPIVLLTTGIFMAVSVFARDFKEGQSYLMPALMALMLPCGVAAVPGLELNAALSFVPVANIAMLIKSVLMGEVSGELAFLTIVSSLMYTALAVVAAARVFSREAVLVGGGDTVRGFLGLDRIRVPRPGPGAAVLVFCTALVAAFYGTLALHSMGVTYAIAVVEIAFLLAPALIAVKLGHFSARETLLLRMADWRGLMAGVLVGVSSSAVAAGIGMRLIRPPADFARALQKAMLFDNTQVSLLMLLLVIAVLPAICEELLFRGFILSGLRGLGWKAVPLTALLFGLAHASIYRMLPTFLVGLFITVLAWKTRSIVPGMIAHAINNGLIAVLVRVRPPWFHAEHMQNVPWSWMAIGALALAIAYALIGSKKTEPAAPGPEMLSAAAH